MEAIDGSDGSVVPRFASRLAEAATNDVASAIQFLFQSPGGEESARRFVSRLKELVASLCQRLPEEIEQLGKPFHALDEAATLRYSRPVYRERLQTANQRARRSASGLWYVYYTLEDKGKTGSPDTVVVLRVRHSAARPLSVEEVEEE